MTAQPVIWAVDLDSGEYPECPLRSDLRTCQAYPGSDINDCPKLDTCSGRYTVPDWCPLKDGGVFVIKK